jgi:hypothetical protein
LKGQVSIEFIGLLTLALLASAILITELNYKTLQYTRSSPYAEAQSLAQKVSYKLDYVVSESNTSIRLDFSPELERDYNITVDSGQVILDYPEGSSEFPTLYNGSLDMNVKESYILEYNGSGVDVRS